MSETLSISLDIIKNKAIERFVTDCKSIVGEDSKESEDHTGELRIYTED